jgi:hypothetical protein
VNRLEPSAGSSRGHANREATNLTAELAAQRWIEFESTGARTQCSFRTLAKPQIQTRCSTPELVSAYCWESQRFRALHSRATRKE